MGKLTCVVMVGFLAIHVAVILDIIAISTPYWLVLHPNATTLKPNTTDNMPYDKGLWEFCIDQNCTALNQTEQTTSFRAVQALTVIGTGMMVLAIILVYSFLLNNRCRDSQGFSAINVLLQDLAWLSLLASVIVFGVQAKDAGANDEFAASFVREFGWSYYVAIAGVCVGSISCLMAFRECRHGAFRHREYENI